MGALLLLLLLVTALMRRKTRHRAKTDPHHFTVSDLMSELNQSTPDQGSQLPSATQPFYHVVQETGNLGNDYESMPLGTVQGSGSQVPLLPGHRGAVVLVQSGSSEDGPGETNVDAVYEVPVAGLGYEYGYTLQYEAPRTLGTQFQSKSLPAGTPLPADFTGPAYNPLCAAAWPAMPNAYEVPTGPGALVQGQSAGVLGPSSAATQYSVQFAPFQGASAADPAALTQPDDQAAQS